MVRQPFQSRWNCRVFAPIGLCLLILLSACHSRVAVSTSTGGEAPETVLVVPFQNMAARFPGADTIRSPIGGKVFPAGEIMADAEALLTQQVIDFLHTRENYKLFSAGRSRALLSQMAMTNEDLVPDREMLVRLGTIAGADLVVAGFVYRFQERVGTAYGVNRPASVAFDLHLIQIPSGRLVWSAAVDEDQQSLSEDLFQVGKFIARKGKWITAGEMARAALDQALQTFP
ncbi:MAG: hypothetical protein PVG78_01610 [Desulfobacterales bacterium]|jgi:hypothetical protein